MARTVRIMLEDDLAGGEAHETVTFALDGVSYEIDLSNEHAEELRQALERYIEAGRRVRGSGVRPARRPAMRGGGSQGRAQEIRAWAQDNGIEVSGRGRISSDVIARYEAAHA